MYELMAYARDVFDLSRPHHLALIDWTNSHHRQCAAACLVQAVYVMERDRQERPQDPPLAPSWWKFFGFELDRRLIDDSDFSIFGAIFKLKNPNAYTKYPDQDNLNPPTFVVAFRGTIIKSLEDLRLDLDCIRDRLETAHRFQLAKKAVEDAISISGAGKVWLTGHSLGSAIALLAGKSMVRKKCPVETYLFNPPFISIPWENIESEKIKLATRVGTMFAKAVVAEVLADTHPRLKSKESFDELSGWIPKLFLNPYDPICSGYIGYFKIIADMIEIGAIKVVRNALHISLVSLLSGLKKDSEPFHLFPSAHLTVNTSQSDNFEQAHGIQQWWKPDIQCRFELHKHHFI